MVTAAKSKYPVDKKDVLFILVILALAITLRVAYFADYASTDIYPVLRYSDGYFYHLWGRDIESGDLWGNRAFMKWPLYAYFLGFLLKLFSGNLARIYYLQFFLGAFNCILVYLIGRIMFNRKVGFAAALLSAWYGLFMFYEGLLIYTSLSIFLNSVLFLFILDARDSPGAKSLFLIGIFLGIATITQASIVLFGIPAVIWILLTKRSGWRKAAYNFSCFTLGLCVVIGGVSLRNYLVEKDFVLISGNTGMNFYIGNNPRSDGTFDCPPHITFACQEDMYRDSRIIVKMKMQRDPKTSEVSRFWFGEAAKFIRENPGRYLGLLLRKMSYVFSPQEIVFDNEYHLIADKVRVFKIMFTDLAFILPLGLLGMFLGFRRFKETALLYIAVVMLSLSVSLFFVATRYRIVMVPFLTVFAASGIFRVWEALRGRNYRRAGFLCAALVAIFLFLNYRGMFPGLAAADPTVGQPPAFELHLLKASEYENNYDYRNALREIGIADALSPDNHYIIFRSGVVYYHMKDFKSAEAKFKKSIEINPLHVHAYYNLGLMYNREGRSAEALEVLRRAAFLDPENAETHYELGLAYKSTGELKEAEKEFNLALEKFSRWRTEDRALVERELRALGR